MSPLGIYPILTRPLTRLKHSGILSDLLLANENTVQNIFSLGKYIIEQMALCGFAILVTVLVMFAHRWVLGQKYKVPHWLLTIVLYKVRKLKDVA